MTLTFIEELICFLNLKVVDDTIQNGRTTWCYHFLPNLAQMFIDDYGVGPSFFQSE